MKKYLSLAAIVCGLMLMTTPAMATVELALQEDGGAITVVASAASFTPLSFSGTFGDYNVTFLTETASNAASGSNLLSAVTSVASTSTGTHILTMLVSEQDYTLPTGPGLVVRSGMGGTYGGESAFTGAATFQMWASTTNNLITIPATFTNGLQTANPASGNGMTFDTGMDPAGIFTRGAGAFSLTTRTNFTTTGIGDMNDSNHVLLATQVPEPLSLVLLGFGLVGLAGIRRKFKK